MPVMGIKNNNTNCYWKFNQHPLTKWSSFHLASFYAAHAHSHLQLQQNACKADWIQSCIFCLYTPRDMLIFTLNIFALQKKPKKCSHQHNWEDCAATAFEWPKWVKTYSLISETSQQILLKTYPLRMLCNQHLHIRSSSRGLLFHRFSTVTFQACYQDNERWINTSPLDL